MISDYLRNRLKYLPIYYKNFCTYTFFWCWTYFHYLYHSLNLCFFIIFIGVVYSGMGPDFRVLVTKGRKEAQKYYLQYGVSTYIRGKTKVNTNSMKIFNNPFMDSSFTFMNIFFLINMPIGKYTGITIST